MEIQDSLIEELKEFLKNEKDLYNDSIIDATEFRAGFIEGLRFSISKLKIK